jgi:hypothetical protein
VGRATLVLAFSFFAFVEAVQACSDFVKVSFERDGKPVEQRFKILIYAEEKIIEPLRFENGFVIPPEIRNLEKVSVRILFGRHNVLFEPIYLSKFGTDWVVGVYNKPFDREYVNSEDAKKVKIIYYLRFVSDTGDSTQLILRVLKKTRARH